jgi:phage-related protein
MTNSMTYIATAIATAGSQAIAFVDAAAPMAGLIAELPALAFAAAAGIGALIVGFHGITDALKSTATGAGVTADQIIAAEHNVAMAQQASTQATKDLAAAREAEMKSDRDLALQLQQANLSLAEAQLNVRDAQVALTQARQQGNPLAVAHAQLALQEANLRVQESTNSLSDTQEQFNKRQQQGVGGSDQVQAALKKQADAVYQVGAAQRALAQTQAGPGASAAAAAYAKLAPAAKAVVDVLKQLVPAWRDVQQATQNSLFAGASTDIRRLANEYLPVLRQQLPAIASAWGQAFHSTAVLAQNSFFVKDMNTALANTAGFIRNAGLALSPLADAFRQFAVVGSTFLPRFGLWIQDIAGRFDHWAQDARDSGRINKWITDGVAAAQKFGQILSNLTGILVGIFKAGAAPAGNFLDLTIKATGQIKTFIDSAKGQGQLKEMFTSLRDAAVPLWQIIGALLQVVTQLGPGVSTLTAYLSLTADVAKLLADHMNLIRPLLPFIVIGFLAWKAAVVGLKLGEFIAQVILWSGWAKLAAAAQWLWNLALDANPIGLVVIAVAALAAGIYLLWTHSAAFRNFWIGAWKDIGIAFHLFISLWKKEIQIVIDFFKDPGGTIARAATTLWDNILRKPVYAAVNFIIDQINQLTGGLNSVIHAANDVPGVHIPDIPSIPHLARGGIVTRPTLALIGEAGPEAVVPLSRGGGVGGGVNITFEIGGSGNAGFDAFMLQWLRKTARLKGGKGKNSVQVAFGQ